MICPFCREEIADDAVKCKQCGEAPVSREWREFARAYLSASDTGRVHLVREFSQGQRAELERVLRVLEQAPPPVVAQDGSGGAANTIAAIASFFLPGLGQLTQGRVLLALIQFVLAAVLWFVFLGWVIHIWSAVDAAGFRRA